jgi:hypothetical protein
VLLAPRLAAHDDPFLFVDRLAGPIDHRTADGAAYLKRIIGEGMARAAFSISLNAPLLH